MRHLLVPLLLVAWPSLAAEDTAAAERLEPGLQMEIFDADPEPGEFPKVSPTDRPAFTRIDPQIDYPVLTGKFPGTDLTQHFYVRWTGLLRVPKDGVYTFYTYTDDGSRLILDGELVVDNGVLHPPTEIDSEELTLKAGLYPISMELYNADGAVACQVYWSSQDLPQEIIPPPAFVHRVTSGTDATAKTAATGEGKR